MPMRLDVMHSELKKIKAVYFKSFINVVFSLNLSVSKQNFCYINNISCSIYLIFIISFLEGFFWSIYWKEMAFRLFNVKGNLRGCRCNPRQIKIIFVGVWLGMTTFFETEVSIRLDKLKKIKSLNVKLIWSSRS